MARVQKPVSSAFTTTDEIAFRKTWAHKSSYWIQIQQHQQVNLFRSRYYWKWSDKEGELLGRATRATGSLWREVAKKIQTLTEKSYVIDVVKHPVGGSPFCDRIRRVCGRLNVSGVDASLVEPVQAPVKMWRKPKW